MPLIGVVIPSHKEMESDVPGRLPRWVPPDELLQGLRFKEPKFGPYPYELVAAMMGEHQERDYVSVTMLVGGCPRAKVLERRENYVLTADRFYMSVRGTMVHRTLESHARPGSLAEARFHAEADGLAVSCSPDLITPEGDLYDYKVTENPPPFSYPWRNHTLQVQYNAWVVRHQQKFEGKTGAWGPGKVPDIRSASLVYLGPKAPKVITSERRQPWITPKGTKTLKNQPYIWTDEEVLEGHDKSHPEEPGLIERITTMYEALDAYPEYNPEWNKVWGGKNEDWRCPGRPYCALPNCLAARWPDGLTW